MWALLLPLPWLFLGLFAARARRGKGAGCFVFVGVFGYPQARLLEAVGLRPAEAWGVSLAIMVVCPLIGYLLGMRLFDVSRQGPAGRSQERGSGGGDL